MKNFNELKLPKELDDHLTDLLMRHKALMVSFIHNDSRPVEPIGAAFWVDGGRFYVAHAATLEAAYRLAYAEWGMNTGLW